MKPKTLKEAFQMLDNQVGYLPFTAIDYLHKHPLTKELEEKIVFALNNVNAHKGKALFYAIVAEEHLSKKFIEPVVALLSTKHLETYESLDEEANYLLQKLAQKYPNEVMKSVMMTLEKILYKHENIIAFYPYLFEVFQYVDKKKYTPWFIKIMKTRFYISDIFLKSVMYLGIPETIPHVRKVLDRNKWNAEYVDDVDLKELEDLYTKLVEGGFPNNAPVSDLKRRGKWEAYYMNAEECRLSEEEVEALSRIPFPFFIIDKRERKEECYCGKTDIKGRKLKYKDCCFEKEAAIVNLPRFTQPIISKKVNVKSVFAP